jgi:hypothetical protein
MFDRQIMNFHLTQDSYKHIVGWPLQFQDLQYVDNESYNKVRRLQTMIESGQDISSMHSLCFATTSDILGESRIVDLIEGGSEVHITNDNFPEYAEAILKYKLMDRVKPQTREFLGGILDVIPEPLLTVFDFQEVERLLCGSTVCIDRIKQIRS